MTTQPRQYHAQLVDLKETLISGDTQDLLQQQILTPFQEKRELSMSNKYQPPVQQQEPISNNPGDYIDFYKLNDEMFDQDSENKKQKFNDPYAFFKQAANQVVRPVSAIKHFCKHPTDPDTFATITVASKFFRNKQFQLKELICLEDYKKLIKLRTVNYIYLLRMITKIDESMYAEVKDRLIKLKGLCKFLELISSWSSTEVSKVYERLESDTQIYDLEEQDEEKKAGADYEDYIFENQDEEDNAQNEISDKFDEGQFYKEYFQKSALSGYMSESFTNNLLNEEVKWQVRAQWIEQVISKFRVERPSWIPWIEAKVGTLTDLDVIVNQKHNEFCTNNRVFYLQEFLEEQLKIQGSKIIDSEDQEAFLKDKYTHEQQVYIEEQNIYPTLKFVTTEASNDNSPAWECTANIRQKFCLKILHQEADTDYFLQVFKRRNFGNEKIYEKRLNLRGRALCVRRFEFQQDPGNYIFLSFVTKQIEENQTEEEEKKEEPLIQEEEEQKDEDNDEDDDDDDVDDDDDDNAKDLDNDIDEYYKYRIDEYGAESDAKDEDYINEDTRSENGENEGQKISLVFSIDSQFKDPLLVKPNTQFLGFFGDKNFLSYKKVKVQVKIPAKTPDEEPQMRNQSALRIFEHDLHNFQKIKAIDLLAPYSKVTRADILNKRFGRTKEGFYYIFEKVSKNDKDSNKTFVYLRNREEIPILTTDKLTKVENKNKQSMIFVEKFYPNEKGDKLFMLYRKDEKFQFARFTLDTKDSKNKKFKQDVFDFKNIKEFLGDDQAKIKNFRFRVLPVNNDFIIIIQKVGKETGEVQIYLNDTLLCQTKKIKDYTFTPFDISYGLNKNQAINKIYAQAIDIYSTSSLKDLQKQQYQVFELFQTKKEWYTQNYFLINQDITFAFPHMFFIYNHDQLYMKDLTKPDLEGYYYMNNFLGIKQKNRPLCVQSYRFNNSLVINVPITEAKYQENQFFLRVNSIQTNSCTNSPYQLHDTLLKYQVYTINEKCSEVSNLYAKLIMNADGKLEKDIRIINKNNSLSIEKWDKNICVQRALITQYSSADLQDRDVTCIINNTGSDESAPVEEKFNNALITYVSDCERFITIQRRESVQIWKFGSYFFGRGLIEYNFEDIFTSQWEYTADEINNQIQDVIIDTMPKGKVDFYLLQSLGFMKKVSYQIDSDTFNEYPFTYKIEKVFNDQIFQFGQQITIANQILYYSNNMIDLNAEVFLADKKTQSGQDLPSLPIVYQFSKLPIYSGDNGLFSLSQDPVQYGSLEEQELIAKSITIPLYNSRMLPQFHQTQFNHPIVPLVDLNLGFTVVFTLNLNITLNAYQYYDGQQLTIMLHETSQFFKYTNNHNLQPGLLLRYFNGVEQRLPIKEKIIQVDRFTLSKDGFNIVIQGLALKEKAGDAKLEIMNGIFIYKINKDDIRKISLAQFIPFATITRPQETQMTRVDFEQSEIDNEIACIGQYTDSNFDYYPSISATDYKESFKPEELEQSDDENEEIAPPPMKKTKSIFSLGTDRPQQNVIKEVNQNKKIPRFQGINIAFPKFDLPSPQDSLELFDKIEKVYNQGIVRYLEYTGEKLDLPRLDKIHNNMKIIVNENGHLFLINRLSNKVYFFYQNQSEKYQVYKFVLSNLSIEGADSSGNCVILWSKDNFVVYDVSSLLSQSSNSIMATISKAFQSNNTGLPVQIAVDDYIQIKQRPKEKTLGDMFQPQKEVEAYLFEIIDCKIINGKIIFKIQEQINVNNPINYVKIFDMNNQVLLNYFEYEQLMLSGDKNYIWLPIENKVYDIENNLSTLFFWPGGQFNSQGFDSMDVFNITNDRSIMATHGILQLAFNMQSCDIQSQSIRDVLPGTNDYASKNLEFFYNLPGCKNIIDSIFNDSAELSASFKASSQASKNEKIQLENQIWRENLIADLNNYINKNGDSAENNQSNYAHFLLSYYEDGLLSKETNLVQNGIFNIFEVLYSHQQPRVDIIEDILNTAVSQMKVPITKCVINKSFLEFLQNADTSQAFKQYLDQSISQTSLMVNTAKYPITSNSQGFTVGSYASPIMDEDFHRKYQGNNESKKDITIQYIFLGDLLVDKGDQILDCLNDIKYLGILNIPFLNYIVQFQWKSVQNEIKLKTLYPFFMLLFLFTLYTMWFVSYIDDVPSITKDTPFLHLMGYWFLLISQIAMVGYFILVEIKQFLKDKIEYISSFWNYTDLLINSLCLSVFVLDLIGGMQFLLRPIASSTLIIVWVKLFYYMRAYDSTSQLIRMIIETVKDIRYFLFVLLIGIVGFAGGFYILQFGLATAPNDNDPSGHQFVGTNPLLAVIYIYQLVMGNFNLNNFGEYEGLNKFEFYFIWFLFVVSCLFLVLVLMNLLIAIMGSTFQKVQESILNLSIRENVLLISENESLFQRKKVFQNAQFLIIITEKQSSGSQAATVDEQINTLRKQLVDKVTVLESQFVTSMGDTQKDLKRKFQDQQEKQKMSFSEAEISYNSSLKKELDLTVAKMNDMFNDIKLQSLSIEKQVTQFNEKIKIIDEISTTIDSIKNNQLKGKE